MYIWLCFFTVSLRWGLGEECPLVGGVALGLLERDIRFRPSSSADPVHVVLNMAFTPEEEPWIRLLIALTCLLRLNDALLVKESSRDLPEPVPYKQNNQIELTNDNSWIVKSTHFAKVVPLCGSNQRSKGKNPISPSLCYQIFRRHVIKFLWI